MRKQLLTGTVEKLKEGRGLFSTLTGHREIEERIARKAEELRDILAARGQKSLPECECEVQIVSLPHLAHIIEKCAVLEKDGRIASSGDYTKVDEWVSADEVAKTIGSVNCGTK